MESHKHITASILFFFNIISDNQNDIFLHNFMECYEIVNSYFLHFLTVP